MRVAACVWIVLGLMHGGVGYAVAGPLQVERGAADQADHESPQAESEAAGEVEATSLLGKPLLRPALTEERRAKLEADLAEARAALEKEPQSEAAIIWVGRRLGYLGRFGEAIEVLSAGLRLYPESHRLLRHRGHRYITLRQFDLAVADLEHAARLVEENKIADEVEPDGAPNSAGQPRSTINGNIWYHLALAQYLRGKYSAASVAWRKCVALAKNDDTIAASTYWLYLALMRDGQIEAAAKVLHPITSNMQILENGAYHRLLLMFKGELIAEELLRDAETGTVDAVTVGYGVATWQLLRGDRDAARAGYEKMLTEPNWPAFGYIAAEVAVARGL